MLIVDPLLDFEYICIEKSDDVYFKYNKPDFIKTVLKNTEDFEGEGNGYHSIIKDNDNNYKLYYRANKCPITSTHEESTPYNLLCIALSSYGINFEKPKLDIINKNTNIILKDDCCSNICPIYLPDINTYLAIGGVQFDSNGIFLYNSDDGLIFNKIKKIIDSNSILTGWKHPNHFDSLNTLVFDKYRKNFFIYVRHNDSNIKTRQIQFTITSDFDNYTPFKKILFYNECNIELYTNHIIQYPDSPFFLGFPTIHDQQTYIKFVSIMFSRDGIKWTNPAINFFNDFNNNFSCVYNFVENLDLNKFYIYQELLPSRNIECFAIDKNKLGYITSKNYSENYFILKLKLKSNKFYILADIKKKGHIFLEIYNSNDALILTSSKLVDTSNDFQQFNMEELNIYTDVKVKIYFLDAVIYALKYDINL